MSLSDIRNDLNKFDKNKLIDLLLDLYKKNNSAKEYLDFIFNPNEKELFKKYQQKIFEAFYLKRGDTLKLKDGKQAISDFKKLEPSKDLLADLMIYYVECGVKFTNEFGDIDEAFYSSLEKMYLQVLTLIDKEGCLDKFRIRAFKIVDETKDIGWGFHDSLADSFYNFYLDDNHEE